MINSPLRRNDCSFTLKFQKGKGETMKTQKLSFALMTLCLFAVTALSGCADGTAKAVPYCDEYAQEKLVVEIENRIGGSRVEEKNDAQATADLAIQRGWKNVEVVDNYIITGECPQATTSFPPAPNMVQYFTLEVDQQSCDDESKWFYAPPSGVGTIGLEWYMNTGNSTIDIDFRSNIVEDYSFAHRQVTSEGRWIPVGTISDVFWFCFYSEEPVTIGLALPPSQKG